MSSNPNPGRGVRPACSGRTERIASLIGSPPSVLHPDTPPPGDADILFNAIPIIVTKYPVSIFARLIR
ncbi:hypothetical protein KOR34_12570 [Posidoniimonas corsicana]|uniref:Uncharacterized protein n=1 Tax=Posidoniimonas corsicana TaxID=1938618 RepID=A0A5C5VF74_9BACT|nr:hypothetical protein KOR34_12570 [Posidoniimonas corsicana]